MTFAASVFPYVRPLLHRLDAETAHRLTINALKATPAGHARSASPLARELFGLHFPNPLGLAAGFDKDAEVPDRMLGLGFGFVEVGTVTPRPQVGNAKPRLFRLREDEAVINRMGFNNRGHDAMLARLRARRGSGGIVGVNLGANKDSADRTADYVAGVRAFADVASYLTINISSPNTPGLRNLQSKTELDQLLGRIGEARGKAPIPMFLKIAPDLSDAELADIAQSAHAVDAIIVSNTTVTRPALMSPHASETGGLSGRPLFDLSTRILARLFVLTEGRIPLIGAGGIADAETAWTKILAGASLLQLYSALVFSGPALIDAIIGGLEQTVQAENGKSLAGFVGREAGHPRYHGLAGT